MKWLRAVNAESVLEYAAAVIPIRKATPTKQSQFTEGQHRIKIIGCGRNGDSFRLGKDV